MGHKGDSDTNHSWSTWNSLQESHKETGWNGDQRKNWDHSEHSTVKTWLEYSEESWRPKEIYCHSNFEKKQQQFKMVWKYTKE